MRAAARVGSHLPLPPLLKRLLEAGATEVTAIVTHGLFSRNALELIENSDISRVVVSAAVEEGKHGDAIHARRLLPSPPCVRGGAMRTSPPLPPPLPATIATSP